MILLIDLQLKFDLYRWVWFGRKTAWVDQALLRFKYFFSILHLDCYLANLMRFWFFSLKGYLWYSICVWSCGLKDANLKFWNIISRQLMWLVFGLCSSFIGLFAVYLSLISFRNWLFYRSLISFRIWLFNQVPRVIAYDIKPQLLFGMSQSMFFVGFKG